MAGEAPGRGAVQAGAGECSEAQLVLAGGDVLGDSLQGSEVGDVGNRVAGLSQELGVDDDAEGLVAVSCAVGLAVLTLEVEVGGGHLVEEISAVQSQAVVLPLLKAGSVAALEQGGSFALAHLSDEGIGIGALSGGDDGDFHTGLFGVGLCQILPSRVGFGLEVQVIDLTLAAPGAACEEAGDHDENQKHCDNFFHFRSSK